MDELLKNMNMIKNHNEIIRLKRKNFQQEQKISQIKSNFDDVKMATNKAIDELNKKIKELEIEKTELKNERDAYREYVESIPKFVRKLFGKRILLEGKNYDT